MNDKILEELYKLSEKYCDHDKSKGDCLYHIFLPLIKKAHQEGRDEAVEEIKKIGLSKDKSTKIYAELENDYEKLQKDMTYNAPELIRQKMGTYLWSVYIAGRIEEKEDILKLLLEARKGKI